MITLDHTIISDDVADKHFVCNLTACKGACCVEGDAGAPLEAAEAALLNEIYPTIKPYLSAEGIAEIEQQGTVVRDEDGDLTTPIINGRECVYAVYDEKKILKCGIEQAYLEGKIDFIKPISCHLYPIRVIKYDKFEALNYDRWHICAPACNNGKALKVRVYQFLKGPLIRKYGTEWYEQLTQLIEYDPRFSEDEE